MSEPTGVPSFERFFRPYKLWRYSGLNCAIYPNPFGALNGYVQLPDTHPMLLESMQYELTTPARVLVMPDGSERVWHAPGYDFFQDVAVPGGWTYGPDLDGWLGFDTVHAGDYWPIEIAKRHLLTYMIDRRRLPSRLEMLDEGEIFHRWVGVQETIWSPELVINHVEQTAEALTQALLVHSSPTGSSGMKDS